MKWLADLLEGSLSPEMTLKLLSAALAGIPLLFGGFGYAHRGNRRQPADRAHRSRHVRPAHLWIRRPDGRGDLLMTSFYIKDPLLAMLSMGMASFFNDTTLPGSWTTCMDVGGRYSGTVSGSMNMLGNFGGMAGPIVVGYVLDLTNHNWQFAFAISSVIYFLGAICWLFIDPVTPLETEPAPDAAGHIHGAPLSPDLLH